MSRRRSIPEPLVRVGIYSVHPVATAPFISLVIEAPELPGPVPLALTLGDAYEVGRELVETVEALLSGSARPWDADPGRTPFASRRSGRGGQRSAGAAAGPRAGSRTPGSRPTRPLDSAA